MPLVKALVCLSFPQSFSGNLVEIINKKITIKAQNVNFKDILKEIEKKSEIKVKIFEKVEDSNVSVDVKDIPLNKIEVLFEKMKLKSFVIYKV